jgi:hypothetical protein
MKLLALLIAIDLVTVHGPNGQIVYVNPNLISNVRQPAGLDSGHWTRGTRCLILMADGRIITVSETCAEVLSRVEAAR